MSDFDAILEMLSDDSHDLITALIPVKDIHSVIRKRGFEVDDKEIDELERYIKKMRTYITDQIHVMRGKHRLMQDAGLSLFVENEQLRSGNGAVNW